MDDLERHRLRQKEKRDSLRRLGVSNIHCVCGEDDPLCFDVEHINRRMFDGVVWGCCANCHRKKSSRERTERPAVGLYGKNRFERAAHRLAGIAEYLSFCAEGLKREEEMMFKLAAQGIDFED